MRLRSHTRDGNTMAKQPSSLHRIEILNSHRHIDGFMYTVPVLQRRHRRGALEVPARFVENGQPLRQRHEQHSTIARTGRGAYSHWERHFLFSRSDTATPIRTAELTATPSTRGTCSTSRTMGSSLSGRPSSLKRDRAGRARRRRGDEPGGVAPQLLEDG